MKAPLLPLVLFFLLFIYSACFGAQITLSSSPTSSITDFYQDFSYCSCDITPSLCDNYCCCDTSCDSGTVTLWEEGYKCLETGSEVQDFCNATTISSFGSFSDLACVYQSNRGTIGYFYEEVTATSITYPSPSKFSKVTSGDSSVTSQIQTALTASGISLGSPYSTSNPYLAVSSSAFFFAPQAGPGGSCVPGVLNISQSSTTYCTVVPTSQNCASLNSFYSGAFCLNGACSSSSSAVTITTPFISDSDCQNVLTGLTVSYTIASSGTSYTLSSASVTPSYSSPIVLGTPTAVNTVLTVTAPSASSGNPGYQLGKAITISPSIALITDASNGNCYATGSQTGTIPLLFGQNTGYRCQSPSACSTAYYIDFLLTTSLTIQKYASKSTQTIAVSGTATSTNCNYESYTLDILYSVDGWELDPQYYVVGAKITGKTAPGNPTNPTTKYLQVRWNYVDPSSVSSPPSNTFYQYFQYLWTPLRDKFGLSS